MKKTFAALLLASACIGTSSAQAISDSLAQDFRTLAAKNFSRYRTVNFSWEMDADHDYSFNTDGKEQEKGRKKTLNTLRFSTMIPIIKSHKASLYANIQYRSYNFGNQGSETSNIFRDENYDYYAGGVNGSYYTRLFHRPLVLSGELSVDGWKKGWGVVQGRVSALMVFKNTYTTNFSLGLIGMTHYSSTPVLPLVTYWHRFANPNLSIDITLPSQMYLRYQMRHQRISLGASMSADDFYLKTDVEGTPNVYLYKEAVVKPEVLYEYIINNQFYIYARAGISTPIKGGLYTKSRKELKIADTTDDGTGAFYKLERSAIPFFNIGVSYSLFK